MHRCDICFELKSDVTKRWDHFSGRTIFLCNECDEAIAQDIVEEDEELIISDDDVLVDIDGEPY